MTPCREVNLFGLLPAQQQRSLEEEYKSDCLISSDAYRNWESSRDLITWHQCIDHPSWNPNIAFRRRDKIQKAVKLTGGSSDYYRVHIANPTTPNLNTTATYVAECNDIIEALELNFTEGNILKAIWRIAALRQGRGKPGVTSGLYDAEKIKFFADRLLVIEQNKSK